MSDTQTQIGKLNVEGAERDAIHIAVAPVVCGASPLSAGMRIGFLPDGRVGRIPQEVIGIVDPFLTESVYADDKFFMFLLPNTITSLRHQWTHPAFEETTGLTAKLAAEAWLRDYCARNSTEYEYIIQCAVDGDTMCFGNEQDDLNSDEALRREFWDRLELVTGKKMTAEQRETEYFRCAC